jgi:hypothetical protein
MHHEDSNMVTAVSNATQAQPVSQSTGTSTKKPAQSEPKAVTGTDSVQLSQLAHTLLAARQEATETSFQTSQEASQGDLQAQKLLTSEAVAKPVAK